MSAPLLTRTPVLLDQGPTLLTAFDLCPPFKAPSLNTVPLGLALPHMGVGGEVIQSIKVCVMYYIG